MVLIGTGEYETQALKIPDPRTISNSLTDLRTVFADPTDGIAIDSQPLENEGDPKTIAAAIEQAADEATDLLLVYFVGHGLRDAYGELHLALRGSELNFPDVGSLPYRVVRRLVGGSHATSKVVILDCCFSGLAITLSAANLEVETAIHGTCVLTSAGYDRTALIVPGEAHPAYTERLLRILREGIPGADDPLPIWRIHRELRRLMGEAGLGPPGASHTELADHVALARNQAAKRDDTEAFPPPPPATPPVPGAAQRSWLLPSLAGAVAVVAAAAAISLTPKLFAPVAKKDHLSAARPYSRVEYERLGPLKLTKQFTLGLSGGAPTFTEEIIARSATGSRLESLLTLPLPIGIAKDPEKDLKFYPFGPWGYADGGHTVVWRLPVPANSFYAVWYTLRVTPPLSASRLDQLVAEADSTRITVGGAAPSLRTLRISTPSRATVKAGLIQIGKGSALTLKLTGQLADGSHAGSAIVNRAVWTTGNSNVAAVSSAGRVRAVSPGTTRVTATIGKVSAYRRIHVLPTGSTSTGNTSTGNTSTGNNSGPTTPPPPKTPRPTGGTSTATSLNPGNPRTALPSPAPNSAPAALLVEDQASPQRTAATGPAHRDTPPAPAGLLGAVCLAALIASAARPLGRRRSRARRATR